MIIISVIRASMFQTCKIISYLVGEFQDFMFCLRSATVVMYKMTFGDYL